MSALDHGLQALPTTQDAAEFLALQAAGRGQVLHPASLVILQEHATISQLLDALADQLPSPSAADALPDFEAVSAPPDLPLRVRPPEGGKKSRERPFDFLRALLFCLAEFPEQHHRKESELLFPKLRARAPMTRRLLDRLEHEHEQGQRWLRELEHALLRFEMMGTSRRETFERLVRRHTLFQRAHMAAEERQVLPLAEQFLAEHDWRELALAFPAGADQQAASATGCDCRSVLARLGAAARGPAVLRA